MSGTPLIEISTGKVVNLIAIGPDSIWTPPDGYDLGQPGGNIGDTWNGTSYIPPQQPLPTLNEYTKAIQDHIDSVAKSKQYNDGVSLASYVNSTKTQWKTEAEIFVAWRDSVWEFSFDLLSQVQSGIISQPTIDQLLNQLPQINW